MYCTIETLLILSTNLGAETPSRVFLRTLRARARENVPEPQSFVASARDNGLTVRGDSKIQDAKRVSRERSEFRHGRIPPNDDLVLRIPVRRDDFIDVLRPDEVAHLTSSVHAL